MIGYAIDTTLVRGIAELEATNRGVRLHRLPRWVRDQFPDPQLLMAEAQPSGARLVFQTAARTIELVIHATRVGFRGAHRPRGSVDLVVNDELVVTQQLSAGDLIEVDLQTGSREVYAGPPESFTFDDLPDGENIVEIWLPHNELLELVELRSDQSIQPVAVERRLWVHHGSSISQGSNASTPTQIWPAVAARRGVVDIYNLGFGGSAVVDAFSARVIRDTPADLISVKLGINVVNLDAMRLRAFVPAVHGFLDTIRDGHPDTPTVLISPLYCSIHEDTPGPGAVDPTALSAGRVRFTATGNKEQVEAGRLTLRVIREAMADVAERRAGDANLHYLDGAALYGQDDAGIQPLPDDLHPDTATHAIIGKRFADYAFTSGGPFSES